MSIDLSTYICLQTYAFGIWFGPVFAACLANKRNPFYYSFVSDLNWLQAPVDLASWKDTWTLQRYGRESQNAKDAFNLLLQSVYSSENNSEVIKSLGGFIAEKNADGVTALPLGGTMATPHQSWYPLSLVVKAWDRLIQAAEEAPLSQTMSYDLVNLGREAMLWDENDPFSNSETMGVY